MANVRRIEKWAGAYELKDRAYQMTRTKFERLWNSAWSLRHAADIFGINPEQLSYAGSQLRKEGFELKRFSAFVSPPEKVCGVVNDGRAKRSQACSQAKDDEVLNPSRLTRFLISIENVRNAMGDDVATLCMKEFMHLVGDE